MRADPWQQIEALFAEAIALPIAERPAFLDLRCGEDRPLRAEVSTLLAEDEETVASGDDPVADAIRLGAARVIEAAIDPMIGQRIGTWLIKDRLGQGGMSTVYLAVRDDEQFRKRVAIKVIKRGMASEENLHRFRNERQILASLEHPNIARLIDAGCTDSGLSYFVMEYVEAVPIDRYCDARRLAIEPRLSLFRTVCSAVSDAHRNLVVHRDLKPSNILVTADGTPKLLDFGIAKMLNPELTAEHLEPTASSQRLMTLGYASPEQIRGEQVTTTSDVFSLGVLLYELLSGCRPHAVTTGQAEGDLEQSICHIEPVAMSAAVSSSEATTRGDLAHQRNTDATRLARRLHGDLDTIVATTLRKEPQRRYRSVDHLNEDLARHLEGLPVAAHKATLRYLASKYLRRYRGATIAATVAMAVVALFVVLLAAQSLRLAREQRAAVLERDRAEAISDTLLQLFQVPEAAAADGQTITARELLDRGAQRVMEMAKGTPAAQATSMETIGLVYNQLGLFAQAEPLLAGALALRREAYGPIHAAVAASLDKLAILQAESGSIEQAVPLFRESLAIYRASYGDDHLEVARALANLGLALHELGDYASAEDLYRESLAIQERHPALTAGSASIGSNLALLLYDQGHFGEAAQRYRQLLQAVRRLEGPDGPEAARLMTELGMTLLAAERYEEAEPLLRRALEKRRRLFPAPHPDTALTELYLATLLARRGAFDEAESLHRKALATRIQIVGPEHPLVADSLAALAETLVLDGNDNEAEALFGQAIGIYRLSLPADHPFTATTLVGLGSLHLRNDNREAAAPLLREALAIRQAKLPADDPRIAAVQRLLAASAQAGDL